jgi:hypothetical protein
MIHFNCPCCDAVPCAPDCTFSQDCPEQHADMLTVREGLAVAQAQAARLREAIEQAFYARTEGEANDVLHAALASPLDTSALDAVRAEEREACTKACVEHAEMALSVGKNDEALGAINCKHAIRARGARA